jgi:mannose-6-phosphate isomerase-like protein (cupin superfamily)
VDSTIVFIEGTWEVTQGDQKWVVGPGYTLVSGPGVMHALKNVGNTDAKQISFHPSLNPSNVPI